MDLAVTGIRGHRGTRTLTVWNELGIDAYANIVECRSAEVLAM